MFRNRFPEPLLLSALLFALPAPCILGGTPGEERPVSTRDDFANWAGSTNLHKADELIGEVAKEIAKITKSGDDRRARRKLQKDLLPKIRLELALPDSKVNDAVAAIEKASKTGDVGDGKIFVMPVDDCVRIRTGERGDEAL